MYPLYVISLKRKFISKILSQDCVDTRQALEDRLARIQADYDTAQNALEQCQLGGGDDAVTSATLGSATSVLALAYLGGVYWRRHFGPDGPAYPLDR
jgi:hypothetical protein